MVLVLDTGAFLAFERGDRGVAALLEAVRRRREPVRTSSGCVARAWRGGARQALVARLLAGVDERPLGPEVSRLVGSLCGRARTADVVDAHVALLAGDGDVVLTSDVDELIDLLRTTRVRATVRRC